MPDPVAWKVVQKGWTVRDATGAEIGKVREITGDENADIFDGLTIARGVLAQERYVPSEQVAEIVEGEVRLKLSRAEVESLERYDEPAAEEQILPETSTWYQRLAWRWLKGRTR
jgi:hypothetical protein